ncbi:stromelysin-3 [Ictalurus furcatus]|uniref:stromelysin-3 n=1 Tax=Ictalurus furcatus TaxID=66913 RepID=UPI002350A8DD|nr:stromelysin-3 [Ictalurus furcatus]
MMTTLLLLLSCALCVHSFPLGDDRNTRRYKDPTAWPEKIHHNTLKKRGRVPHAQNTLKEDLEIKRWQHHSAVSKNGSDIWNRPRCGVPDYPSKQESFYNVLQSGGRHVGRYRGKRYAPIKGWNKTSFTYKILRTPWQMNLEKVREVFRDAVQVWSHVTPLTFTEVQGGHADITIDFVRYEHGDKLPFDGPGGILAHAFFPRTHRQGEVHFDYDEHWTLGNGMGTDMLQVAVHEIGHTLGLQHSTDPGSVMSAIYSFSYPPQLSKDDEMRIQSLYGVRTVPQREPELDTNDIMLVPNSCDTDFDAVSMIRGELFFFKSGYVWRIRDGKLQDGYPALASRHWRGIPYNIDAAYEDTSGNIWFFKGQNYWVYDAEKQISGPDSVQKLGLPVSNIQAALMWGEDKTQKVYFFKGENYWRFNPQDNWVDMSYARTMVDWRGIPNDIDAAFQDRYGFAHFLKGRQYWKFDPVEVKALEGYPRYISMDFFNCPTYKYQ